MPSKLQPLKAINTTQTFPLKENPMKYHTNDGVWNNKERILLKQYKPLPPTPYLTKPVIQSLQNAI